MKRVFLIFFVLIGVLANTNSVFADIPQIEREALIALYNSTDGDNWTDNSGWKDSPLHTDEFSMPGTEHTWSGVTIESDKVTSLNFNRNYFAGSLPPEIGNLSNLESLVFSYCTFTGGMPSELGNLSNLWQLSFGETHLTENIPPELGNLANLQYLTLPSGITGTIPPELGNLLNLRSLNIPYGTYLTGNIPPELGNLSNLERLNISNSTLTGGIPKELGNLTKLSELQLKQNRFLTGSIPNEFKNLINLQRLYIFNNQLLSGSIPAELGNLTNLQTLSLSNNQLSGSIPAELDNLTNLQTLFLGNNQLSGSIPAELGNLTSLQTLSLSDNQLSGSIPAELGNLTSLQYFFLSNNQLSGSIPAEFGNLTNLQRLHLFWNQLSGSIPTELGNLSNLRELDLSNNQLNYSIPPEFGELINLQYFFLYSNQLNGSIPPELGNLINLIELKLFANQLSGSIPEEITNLTNLADNRSDFCNNYLYTANQTIRDFLNIKQEGGDWESCQNSSERYFVPFFRLYKTDGVNRDHLYTTNPIERDSAISAGYTFERVEGNISNRPSVGMVPLYRLLYNDGTKTDHFYTISESEKNNAVDNFGYTFEGIAGYVYDRPVEGSVALYRMYNPTDKNHFYCIRKSEKEFVENNQAWSFVCENSDCVECYVLPSESTEPWAEGRPSGRYGSANTAIGAFKYSKTLISFPSPGPALRFSISYDSSSTNNSVIGTGWTHSYDCRIYETEDHYVLHRGNGRMDYYTKDTLSPVSGAVYNSLAVNGEILTITTPAKTKYEFGYMSASEEDRKKGFYLKKIEDRYGNPSLSLDYSSGRITSITDPVGRTIIFSYVNDYLNSITDDQLGRVISFGLDEIAKNLLWFTDMKGQKTTFDYEVVSGTVKTHRIVEIIDPSGATALSNTYDETGRLIFQKNALNNETTFSYEDGETVITGPLGNKTHHKNNELYELVEKSDPLSGNEIYEYTDENTDHELSKYVDKKGHISQFTYNPSGAVKSTDHTINIDGQLKHITTTTEYHPDFTTFPITHTDPLSETTQYGYDVSGSLVKITDPDGKELLKSYYSNGQLKTLTDKNSNMTTYIYGDTHKNLTRIERPLGSVIIHQYDEAGRRISTTDSRGNTTTFEYDINNNLVKSTDPYSNSTIYTYDANNRMNSVTDAQSHSVVYTYDSNGRIITQKTPSGLVTSYAYDVAGRRISATDPSGKMTSYEYDRNSNLIKITNPISNVHFVYDANGNIEKVIDDHGNVVENQYDHMDRLADTKDPLNKTTYYSYYDNGNLFSRLDAEGIQTEYRYDKLGRITKVIYPDNSSIEFVYDYNGNMTRMIDQTGTTDFAYDANNRPISVNDPFGNIVSYGYDTEGNRISITYPGNKTVNYEYDKRNRLTKVTDWLRGVTDYLYDSVGNLTRINNPNLTYITLVYNSDSRLTSLANYKPDSSVISSYSYTLDNSGNITAVDSVDPLEPVDSSESVSYTYNQANQLVFDGSYSYVYDNNGNLIQRTGTSSTTFGYNYENLLTTISGSLNMTNTYNGLGMRIARTVDGTQTQYILDPVSSLPSVLAETDTAGNIQAYYIYGLGLVSRISTSGSRLTYHFNHRGDTIALTDNTGNIVDAYAYDEYGKTCNHTGATLNPFKYVGRYGVMAEGDNFYFMQARYYSADNGRFLSKDPIGFEGGDYNLYSYVGGNPTLGIDPSGLKIQISGDIGYTTYINDLLDILRVNEVTKNLINYLENTTPKIINIQNGSLANVVGDYKIGDRTTKQININIPYDETYYNKHKTTDFIALAHELGHAEDLIRTNFDVGPTNSSTENYTISRYENPLRRHFGLKSRDIYDLKYPIWSEVPDSNLVGIPYVFKIGFKRLLGKLGGR
jgi:RHS repeat-associated protein